MVGRRNARSWLEALPPVPTETSILLFGANQLLGNGGQVSRSGVHVDEWRRVEVRAQYCAQGPIEARL